MIPSKIPCEVKVDQDGVRVNGVLVPCVQHVDFIPASGEKKVQAVLTVEADIVLANQTPENSRLFSKPFTRLTMNRYNTKIMEG